LKQENYIQKFRTQEYLKNNYYLNEILKDLRKFNKKNFNDKDIDIINIKDTINKNNDEYFDYDNHNNNINDTFKDSNLNDKLLLINEEKNDKIKLSKLNQENNEILNNEYDYNNYSFNNDNGIYNIDRNFSFEKFDSKDNNNDTNIELIDLNINNNNDIIKGDNRISKANTKAKDNKIKEFKPEIISIEEMKIYTEEKKKPCLFIVRDDEVNNIRHWKLIKLLILIFTIFMGALFYFFIPYIILKYEHFNTDDN
jgi:hypothetical protein